MARADELNIPRTAMPPPSASYRVPRRKSGLEGNTKRMALVAGGLAAGLAVLMGVWSLGAPRRGGGVPVVQADSRPLRVKPENPGGMEVEGQDSTALSGKADGVARLAPAPELPDVAALKQQAAAAAAAAAKPAPTPAVPAPTPVVATPAPAPVPKPVQQALVTAKPTPKPVPAPTVQAASTAPARSGGAQVQLAAVGSEDAAKSEWARLEHKMPDLLASRKPALSKIDRDGKTLWRVRTGGFADSGEAAVFCERVRSKGAGCTVASF